MWDVKLGETTALESLWAKSTPVRCSLPRHMIDTAHVAGVLWDDVLSDRTRTAFENVGLTRQSLMLLAGLHDLGKASPGFQAKRPELYSGWPEELRSSTAALVAGRETRHEHVSYHAVRSILGGPDGGRTEGLALVVGGHHGVYPSAGVRAGPNPLAVGGESWDDARRRLWEWLAEILGADLKPASLPRPVVVPTTGLVIVSDWIASNEHWFTPSSSPLAEYVEESRRRAEAAIRRLTWRRWKPRPGLFVDHFPGFRPRPIQRTVEQIAGRTGSGSLVIIEAETGSGKTEAALHLAARWVERGDASGIFLALPTRATSNAMFTRVLSFLERTSTQGGIQSQLVHGWASLESEFQRLFEFRFAESGTEDQEERRVAAAHRWFTYRRRGLLAPIGVGTIDQVLMAGLAMRYTPLRIWGLADKVVVVDEVHAYDTYMSTLLDRVLAWLGALEVPVILLSATLPVARKRELLEAYSGRDAAELGDYPSVAWISTKGDGGSMRVLPSRGIRRVVVRRRPTDRPEDPACVAELALDWSERGANVLVVCNTVRRAQRVANSLRSLGDRLHLIHARLRFDDRSIREGRLLDLFGPRGESRPRGHVVVGTQVVEQSLDIDLDVLVTDVAPMDLLIQRMGRIHRHAVEARAVADPLMLVTGFSDVPSVPRIDPGTAAVYHPWVLYRTLAALPDLITEPDDVPVLISAVYDDTGERDLPDRLAAARDNYEESMGELAARARQVFVPPPRGAVDLVRLTDPAVDDLGPDEAEPGVDRRLLAQTRIGSPSVTLVVSRPGESEEPEAMLRRSFQVSSPTRLVDALTAEPSPDPKDPLLRYVRHLQLDESGRAQVGGVRVRYDDLLGLLIDDEEAPDDESRS